MKFKQLFLKYKEVVLYIIFGVITTLVDWVSYIIFSKIVGEANIVKMPYYITGTAIAWILAVTTAFITNKLFVFESKSWHGSVLRREIPEFYGARLFAFGLTELGMFLLISVIGLDDMTPIHFIGNFDITGDLIAKAITSVISLVLNYVFSKFVIFTKKKRISDKSMEEKENNAKNLSEEKDNTSNGKED